MGWLDRVLPGARRRRLLRELGAEFRRHGRDEFLYVDGERRLPIHAEVMARGELDFVVDRETAVGGWLPPHEAEPLDEPRRREVLELFLRWLAIFDYRVEVRSGSSDSST